MVFLERMQCSPTHIEFDFFFFFPYEIPVL